MKSEIFLQENTKKNTKKYKKMELSLKHFGETSKKMIFLYKQILGILHCFCI